MSSTIIDALNALDQTLFPRLEEEINEESLFRYLKVLSDTHAPYQTAAWTRGRALERLLAEDGYLERPNFELRRNYKNTGDTLLLLGSEERKKKIWLLAHLDTITYLVEPGSNGRYPLTPICYHLMEDGERPAVALGYNLESRGYEILAHGQIVSNKDELYFKPDNQAELRPGTRVVFDSQLVWDRESGEVRGSLDDAAGATALVMAARFLADYDIELMLGLTDEEEGLAGMGSQSICRGGLRLLPHFDQPSLVIASDIHESTDMYGGGGPDGFVQGQGASFTEKASGGLGEITPPHLYELQRQLSKELSGVGIQLRENLGGYVSRTEGVNAMYRTPNVALIGFLGANRHFQRDVESANIHDLVNIAKTVVCYVLLTETPVWQQVQLDS
ncbi:MAG: hypothetical protein ACLFWD_13695 [Anaerolineales bacterium]